MKDWDPETETSRDISVETEVPEIETSCPRNRNVHNRNVPETEVPETETSPNPETESSLPYAAARRGLGEGLGLLLALPQAVR